MEDNIVMEKGDQEERKKKQRKLKEDQIKKLEDEQFAVEYKRAGGIQHIICSATLTIDDRGRITPRGAKKDKKKNQVNKWQGKKGTEIAVEAGDSKAQ